MADRIKGITIEIGGDTTNLSKSLKGVNAEIKNTQAQLKDVEKLLKLDPTNTDLLKQKQKLLADQVKETKEKLDKLKEAQATMDANGVDKNSEQYMALQREIIATEQSLKEAESAARNFNATLAQISATAEKVSSATAKAAEKTRALSTAAAGALAAIGGLAYKAAQNADELNTLAKQTGFTTDEIQKFQYASELIDVNLETITGAAAKMTKQLSSSESKFTDLGVATRDVNGNFRSTSDIFYDTVAALGKIENETERDTAAMDIFGKSANELAGIIDDGGAALKSLGEEAENAGLIMDSETLNSLNEVNDEIDRLKAQGAAQIAKAGASALEALQPVLEKVVSAIAKVLEYIGSLSPETMKTILVILAVIAAISPLLTLISSLSSAIAFLASPIGLVIAAVAAVIAIGVLLYKHWDEIKEKAAEIGEKISEAWNNLKERLAETVENIKNSISEKWNAIKSNVSSVVDGIRTNIVNRFNSVKSSVSSIFEGIKNSIREKIESAKNFVKTAVDKIKSFFSFQISIPHIRLPHFSWNWTDLGVIKIPNISVQWYKKAYEQPYLFNQPTVVGNRGFGDGNGAEMVYGKDALMRDIREAMSASDTPIYITTKCILDNRVVGQAVTKYQRQAARSGATNYA